MSLRILVAPDKYKGTLSAHEAARAIARGWRAARPDDRITRFPICDGGDGFGDTMARLLNARCENAKTVDAADRPCTSRWWWASKTKTALIESANVIGLAMLPSGKHHPFDLDTFGLGRVMIAASAKGASRCILGIGGSATNDGGFGMARAIGWVFCDINGNPIDRWTQLHRLAKVLPPKKRRLFRNLTVAVDVQNQLLGAKGCSRIYGPQKGLKLSDMPAAEKNLRQLARVMKRQYGMDYSIVPGAGAAGGLGFGLLAFANAKMTSGFNLFALHSHLSQELRHTDLVITGEGALDNSTLMGKGVGALAQLCQKSQLRCIGLAGRIENRRRLKALFERCHSMLEITTEKNALREPARWLEQAARNVAIEIRPS